MAEHQLKYILTGTDNDNGLYIKRIQIDMENLLLLDITENSKYSLVVLGDETENNVLEVVKQSTFKNLNICGKPIAVEVRRIFDSSFYDCFFSSVKNNTNTDTSSSVFYVKPNNNDNSNSINFVRCHFENSESNSTLMKIHNSNNKYHHGITFTNCHFETRNLSTKSFDLEFAERVIFYGCSFSRNKYDLDTENFNDIANVLTNTRLVSFNECIFSGTNNNNNAPYIKLNENIYALNIVNTYMYGEVNDFSQFLDCSNVNEYDIYKQTWNLNFSKGLVGYNRFNNNLHLSLEEGSYRFDFLNAKSKFYDDFYDEMFIKFNSTSLPTRIDQNHTEQISINYLGAITQSLISGTHDYQLEAGATQIVDIKMLNNANRVGFYFIFDSEAGATPQYGIVFRAGVQLVKAVGTINVSANEPTSFDDANLYCYISDNKLTIKNNNNATRRIMVLPITFK